ncbi:hypothetical protein [cf. Phormidesmis sp. LEGE 11477]|uniref:hypothetical protein n=1 Tax=cf. Phormidesmis sp. LEGE 11477 TaxID=1828680 RepID=UPI001881ED1F|nr:hypothetical protein [cf. Phormidesmis sp. LEGE 11477]MBE9062896.1 hypothetical protein [cf. Phormidesmis sp. LEGE 11477]
MRQDSELALCYERLQLRAEATLEEVDAAYFRLRSQCIQANDRKSIAALKAARETIREHLQAIAIVRPTPTSTLDPNDSANPLEPLITALSSHAIAARASTKNRTLNLAITPQEQTSPSQAVALVKRVLREFVANSDAIADIETIRLYQLDKNNRVLWRKTISPPQPRPQAQTTADDLDLYSFQNRVSNAVIFPGLLLIAALLNSVQITKHLLFGVDIWIHEFGHATIAWLGGHRATPLPFGWTNVGDEKSLFVYFGVLILLGLLFWRGIKEESRWSMGLAVGLGLAQFCMTWLISEDTFDMLLSFGGIGGEFYLSTLLIVSFYFPLPEYWRWDFFRYPAALFAGFTLIGALWQWRQIDRGLVAIPWGSLFGGSEHIGGDMNQLSIVYGWSDQRIIDTYNSIGGFCLAAIVSVYLFFFIKQQSHLWLHRLWRSRR